MKFYDADFFEIIRDEAGRVADLRRVDVDAEGIKVLVDADGNAPPLSGAFAFQKILQGKTVRLYAKDEMIRIPWTATGR